MQQQADVVARARVAAKWRVRRRLGRQRHGLHLYAGQAGDVGGAAVDGQFGGRDLAVVRQDAGDGETIGNVGQHLGRGQQRQRRLALAQHQQAGDVVDLRVHQQHGGDAAVAHGPGRLQFGRLRDLLEDVG